MTPGDNEPQRLGDLWDALVTGQPEPTPESMPDPDLLAVIRDLHQLDDVPAPDPALEATIWQSLTGSVLPAVVYAPLPITLPSPNGKETPSRLLSAPLSVPVRESTGPRWRELVFRLFRLLRLLAVGSIAGFGAGFITGIGARLAMRISGYLTSPTNRGRLTENEAVVGEITLGGTLSLAIVAGMIGVLGGVIYLIIRSRLPKTGWQRGLIYGGLLLATFGFVVMDESNPDYRLFGPPALNVMTFSLIYLVFGLVAAPLADLIDHLTPDWSLMHRHRVRGALVVVAMLPFAFIGIMALLFAVLSGGLASVAILAGLGVIAPLLSWVARRLNLSHRRWLQPAFAGYAVVGASCCIGFILTARGIAGILGVG